MGHEFNLSIRFALKDQHAETSMRELVSEGSREPMAPAAPRARALLSFVGGAGEIRSLHLARLPENKSDLSHSPLPESFPATASEWALDTSGVVVRSDDHVKAFNRTTDAMIEAGKNALALCFDTDGNLDAQDEVVTSVFQAMMQASVD